MRYHDRGPSKCTVWFFCCKAMAEVVSEEQLFNDVFTADDKEDVICEIVRNSIMIFPDQPFIFNLDARRNLFIPLLKLTKDNLRSVLKRFVCKEMERFNQREGLSPPHQHHHPITFS
jgi:hypothetical protein